jgi:putative tryptophan/tyrosine transport system substrate-binding protein
MQCDDLKRREFFSLLGASAAWPLVARAQQQPMPLIGYLSARSREDTSHLIAAFQRGLAETGYIEGQNVAIEYRFALGQYDRLPMMAAEFVRRPVDVIATTGGEPAALAAKAATSSVPIVFTVGSDPVKQGLAASFNRPGGNATGIALLTNQLEPSAKWLELLRETAPGVTRVAVIRDPTARTGGGQLGAIQAVAPSLGVELSPIDPHEADAIERGLAAFARERAGGLIVTTSRLARVHRDLIVALAARHRLPAVYPFRVYVAAGGLVSYGPDFSAPYRRAAGYVDRILKGEKPADLPVQAPTKYQLVVNLKTAKALGLEVPATLLARADEVIE